MKIEILGPGCPNCVKLEENTKKVVEDLELSGVEIKKIEDMEEIVGRGVMSTPALAVDGEVKISGRVAEKSEIKDILV